MTIFGMTTRLVEAQLTRAVQGTSQVLKLAPLSMLRRSDSLISDLHVSSAYGFLEICASAILKWDYSNSARFSDTNRSSILCFVSAVGTLRIDVESCWNHGKTGSIEFNVATSITFAPKVGLV